MTAMTMTPAMTEDCQRFMLGRDIMLAREISAMTAMTEPQTVMVHQNEQPPSGRQLVMALKNLPRMPLELDSWLRSHGYTEAWALDSEVGRVLVVMAED